VPLDRQLETIQATLIRFKSFLEFLVLSQKGAQHKAFFRIFQHFPSSTPIYKLRKTHARLQREKIVGQVVTGAGYELTGTAISAGMQSLGACVALKLETKHKLCPNGGACSGTVVGKPT
jgi:hypothetical protein